MKPLLLLFPFIFGCGNASSSDPSQKSGELAAHRQATIDAGILFTHGDAVAVLGESCHIIDSTYSGDKGIARFNSGYKADNKDPGNGDTGAVYFVFEEYSDTNAAHGRYAFILAANRKNGARDIAHLGNEAYYHTDNTHFRFIMARKNNRIIVMKINKMTSHTSDDAFRQIAEKIATMI